MRQDFTTLEDVLSQRPIDPAVLDNEVSAVEAQVSGYLLRQLRKSQGLSQEQLAERMGVSQRRVSAIERGKVDRSEVATIRSYVTALGGELKLVAQIGETSTLIA
jgi:DNA-binding XRE family transcriptional regulator